MLLKLQLRGSAFKEFSEQNQSKLNLYKISLSLASANF